MFCFPITSLYYQPLESLCLDPAELLLSIIFKCLLEVKKETNPKQLSPVIFLPTLRKQVCLFFNECKRMQTAVRKSLGNDFSTSLFRLPHVYQLSPAKQIWVLFQEKPGLSCLRQSSLPGEELWVLSCMGNLGSKRRRNSSNAAVLLCLPGFA